MISEARVTTSKSQSSADRVAKIAKVKADINKKEAEKAKKAAQRKPSGAAADPSTQFKKKKEYQKPTSYIGKKLDTQQQKIDKFKDKAKKEPVKTAVQTTKKVASAAGKAAMVVGKVAKATTGGMSKMYSSNRSLSSHYDWRDDLGFIDEIAAGPDKKDNDKIDPKNVKNKITINPDVKTEDKDPCWDTHKQVGMKKKGGKMVPNCVPKEEMGNISHTKSKKGGKTIINVNKNDEADAQKAMKNDPKYILGKTRVQSYEEIEMSRKEYKKIHKDFKSDDPKKPRTTKYVQGKGTVSMPVKFTDEYQSKEGEKIDELSKKTLANYTKKSATDLSKKSMEFGRNATRELSKKMQKRHSGILKAASKLAEEERDDYGDPIGGPKLSKKEKKKNLSTYEGDKITEGTWLKEYTEKKMERTMRDKIHPNTLVGTGGYKKNVQKMTPQEEMSAEFGDGRIKVFDLLKPAPMKGMADIFATEESNPRIPRKKGQPANSKKHSDLYTDENPKGTIHGLGFKDVATAKASVSKIRNSSRSHAHKIQAAVAMEQRAREMGKTSEAAVYRKFINSMKKKTKKSKVMGEMMMDKIVSDYLSELNRYEKEKGIDTKTNKKIEKGGTAKNNLALQSVMKKYGSQRMGANQPKKVKGAKSTVGTGKMTQMMMKKKDQAASSKAFADRAKKAGYKSTQDYANVVSRYGSEKNMKQGRGLGS